MTQPVTNLTITIDDQGRCTLRAADATTTEQSWAIPARPVPLAVARQVAQILGADAVNGLEARLHMVVERQRRVAATEQAAVERARAAQQRVAELEAVIGATA